MPSVEIRELESKLRAGYMNKERAAQLMEKEVIKQEEEASSKNLAIIQKVFLLLLKDY